jgi:hypothetical protein
MLLRPVNPSHLRTQGDFFGSFYCHFTSTNQDRAPLWPGVAREAAQIPQRCLGILVNFLEYRWRSRDLASPEHDPVPTTLSAARDLTPGPALLI